MIPRAKALLTALALLATLAIAIPAQEEPRPRNGLLSPQESLAFIQGLAERNLHQECLQQCQEFLQRYPRHEYQERVELTRIRSLCALARTQDAARDIQSHLEAFPNSPHRAELLQILGNCLQELHQEEQAVEVYQQLLAQAEGTRETEEARYRLAVCLASLNRVDEAKKELLPLVGKTADAQHLPRVHAKYYMAVLRQNQGDNAAALLILEPLLQIQGLPDETRKNLLLTAGYLAFAPPVRDYPKAAQAYGAFLSEFPKDARRQEIQRNLLSCLYAQRDFPRFLEAFQQFRQEHPQEAAQDQELTWLAAQANLPLEKWEDARTLLQELLNNPRTNPALRQKAAATRLLCLENLRLPKETLQAARQFLEEFPNSDETAEVLLRLAAAHLKLKHPEDAIQSYRKAMPLLAASASPLYQDTGVVLARLLTAQEHPAEAATLYLDLAQRVPETATEGMKTADDLRKSALAALADVPEDPRAIPLATQLLANTPAPEERLPLLQLQLHFQTSQGLLDDAEKTATELLSLATPAAHPQWLLKRAALRRARKNYQGTLEDYQALLQDPNATRDARAQVLPDLLTLLYYLKQGDRSQPYLEEFFATQPPLALSTPILAHIARERREAHDLVNAARCYQRILESATLSATERTQLLILLAEVYFQEGDAAQCKKLLKESEELLQEQGLPPASDALALLAELALRQDDSDLALTYARQAMEGKDAPLLKETLPRARWAQAQALLNLKDYAGAFSAAAQGFILEKDPAYTPKCYLIAAAAKDAQGDSKTAQELRNAAEAAAAEQ